MLTDWVLIARLARELSERLRGARVEDAGLLDDGRIALLLRMRGSRELIVFDLFAPTPLVTLEEGELAIATEPSFIRTLARALRSMVLAEVSARRGDRLLRLSFASRSRFGVGDRLELYLELVPRFGNAVLVKDETVVAALREFSPAENPRRSVQAGLPYTFPPVPSHPRTLDVAPPDSALETFAALHAAQALRAGDERTAVRKRSVLKRLDERERRLLGELDAIDEKRARAAQRDSLRTQGEAIFATLHELTTQERYGAKEHAAKLFAQYKKLGKSLPHLQARERSLRSSIEAVDTMRWEAERAGTEDLDAVEAAVAELTGKPVASAPRPPRRRRPPLEYRTPLGSRIVVGRSPTENAELTFRVARPSDLWFHARGIPGAHVILARDDRAPVPDEDLALAASLAAFHSRARAATSVPVDYTLCKHVRKQRAAAPGLVWYTNAKTLLARPSLPDRSG